MSRLAATVLAWWRRWSVYRQTPPLMEPEQFAEALLSSRTEVFWAAVEQYAQAAANPEKLLQVKKELGLGGHQYMVGYIKGVRDLLRFVNHARQLTQVRPSRPSTPIRTGGIAKYVQ